MFIMAYEFFNKISLNIFTNVYYYNLYKVLLLMTMLKLLFSVELKYYKKTCVLIIFKS